MGMCRGCALPGDRISSSPHYESFLADGLHITLRDVFLQSCRVYGLHSTVEDVVGMCLRNPFLADCVHNTWGVCMQSISVDGLHNTCLCSGMCWHNLCCVYGLRSTV